MASAGGPDWGVVRWDGLGSVMAREYIGGRRYIENSARSMKAWT